MHWRWLFLILFVCATMERSSKRARQSRQRKEAAQQLEDIKTVERKATSARLLEAAKEELQRTNNKLWQRDVYDCAGKCDIRNSNSNGPQTKLGEEPFPHSESIGFTPDGLPVRKHGYLPVYI